MFITHCILHIVYPVDADWAIYEICFLRCRAMIGLCWIDACVDASKQKLSEALFSHYYTVHVVNTISVQFRWFMMTDARHPCTMCANRRDWNKWNWSCKNSWNTPLKTVGTPHSKQLGRSTKNQKPDQLQMSVFALYCGNPPLDGINQKLHLALIIGFAKTVRPHNNLLLTGFIKTFIRQNKI